MYQAGHELAQSLSPDDGYKVMTTSWEVCIASRYGYADEVEGDGSVLYDRFGGIWTIHHYIRLSTCATRDWIS